MISKEELLAKLQTIKESTQSIIDKGGTNAETTGNDKED